MPDDKTPRATSRAITGCLLGTATADAIGLPFEGLSRRRVERFLAGQALKHRFLLGRGFCSDDTEHTCMVAQSLLAASRHAEPDRFLAAFRASFAWRLRFWLLGLPAGIGLATLRSIVKLWLYPVPNGEGVSSAGNGAAMRSAIIGACLGHRPALMRQLVSISTRLTHTDPRAEHGALAVAMAASYAACNHPVAAREVFPEQFARAVGPAGSELARLIGSAAQSASLDESTETFAATLDCGNGVTGFVMHTVPVALHAWFRHERDYRRAIDAVVRCGGDTDTAGAIIGGIVGAGVGRDGIPADWLQGISEYPRSLTWMEQLGSRLGTAFADGRPSAPLPLNVPLLLLRNVLFMIAVLGHGFRRLLPPY